VAFQAPFEIAQSQLQSLRLSSVDSREIVGGIFPFFDENGATRFILIDTLTSQKSMGQHPGAQGGLWVVEEFPLEIRFRKAIYPRPIVNYRPLGDLDPMVLSSLYFFDARKVLASQSTLPEHFGPILAARNVALRVRGRERIRDLFFTLDLRRLTGAASRSGVLLRRRLEIAGLRTFLRDTEPAGR